MQHHVEIYGRRALSKDCNYIGSEISMNVQNVDYYLQRFAVKIGIESTFNNGEAPLFKSFESLLTICALLSSKLSVR